MARISRGAQTPGNQAWKRVSFPVTWVEETSIADVLDENKVLNKVPKGWIEMLEVPEVKSPWPCSHNLYLNYWAAENDDIV